jgi:hypothetical protein
MFSNVFEVQWDKGIEVDTVFCKEFLFIKILAENGDFITEMISEFGCHMSD